MFLRLICYDKPGQVATRMPKLYSYGPYSYGLYSHGRGPVATRVPKLYSYGLYSYGLGRCYSDAEILYFSVHRDMYPGTGNANHARMHARTYLHAAARSCTHARTHARTHLHTRIHARPWFESALSLLCSCLKLVFEAGCLG